jgi:hypothetical protein
MLKKPDKMIYVYIYLDRPIGLQDFPKAMLLMSVHDSAER